MTVLLARLRVWITGTGLWTHVLRRRWWHTLSYAERWRHEARMSRAWRQEQR